MVIIDEKFKKERELKAKLEKLNELDFEMNNLEVSNGVLRGAKYRDIIEANIPKGIEKINANAFYDCKKLRKVIIPNTVTHIGENAFAGCENVEEIIIPSSVQFIGNRAFHSCINLKNIKFEEKENVYSTLELGSFIFAGCEKLENVQFCEGLLNIPAYAFYGCSSLTNLDLPDSCQQIKEKAFSDSKLESLRVGLHLLVAEFDVSAIKDAYSFREISVPKRNVQQYRTKFFIKGIDCSILEEIDVYAKDYFIEDEQCEREMEDRDINRLINNREKE